MVTTKDLAAAGGYWTVQVINKDRDQVGLRYVCHAHDDQEARDIAGQLSGQGNGGAGYDYHRINNPVGRHTRDLGFGESERIGDPDTWAVLQAARRGA